jgi:dihydroxyacetone kinase-like protein
MSDSLKPSRRVDPEQRVKITPETVRRWISLYAEAIRQSERRLTQLDASIGDGDHGTNMRRGLNAVEVALAEMGPIQLAAQFRTISAALTTSVGGASGPLYGAFFLHVAQVAAHKNEFALADLTAVIEAGCRGVVQLGKAQVGDKTMVDTLTAAVTSLRTSLSRHESLPLAVQHCRDASLQAAEATTPMIARKGRASYLGERSAGHQDPGATSSALLFECLSSAVGAPASSPALFSIAPQPTLASP